MKNKFIVSLVAAFVVNFYAFPELLEFNPGAGEVTNVENRIYSNISALSILSGTVNLLSEWNVFSGNVTVADQATLGAVKLRAGGLASSLGVNPAKLTLGKNSTFKYLGTGPDFSDTSLHIAAGEENLAAVVDA